MLEPIRTPTLNELEKISDKKGLQCTESELASYQEVFRSGETMSVESFRFLLNAPEPVPRVSYPRLPGYRPSPEENPLNAWYWKSVIEGSKEGPLKGRSVVVKDCVAIAGLPLMNGSRSIEGYIPEYDATVVTRILNAGGTLLGKATCEDLCLSASSYHNVYGAVRNPWNPKYSSGGSSSGTAVLVANGEVDMAVATDQGGSIRNPAAHCGLVGFKPTFGMVPFTGILPMERTVDHAGPIARTVTDAALLLQVMAGYDDMLDPRQPSIPFPVPNFMAEMEKPVTGLKIGVLKEGFINCDKEVEQCVRKAIEAIEKSGKFAEVREVSVPWHPEGRQIWWGVCFQGVTDQIMEGGGYRTGYHGFHSYALSDHLFRGVQANGRNLSHNAKMFALFGSYISENYGYRFCAKAHSLARKLRQDYDAALKEVDVLITPTLLTTPGKLPDPKTTLNDIIMGSQKMNQNTMPFNITYHPAMSLNAGYSRTEDMPVGLQIVGRRWDDALLLRVGKTVEDILKPFQKPLPTKSKSSTH